MSAVKDDGAAAGHHSLLAAANELAEATAQPALSAGRRVHDALHAAAIAIEDHFEIARESEAELGEPELLPRLASLERELAALLDACWETIRTAGSSEAVLRLRIDQLARGVRRAAEHEIALVQASLTQTPALD